MNAFYYGAIKKILIGIFVLFSSETPLKQYSVTHLLEK